MRAPADSRRVVGVWSQTVPGFLPGVPLMLPGDRAMPPLSDPSTSGELGALPSLLHLRRTTEINERTHPSRRAAERRTALTEGSGQLLMRVVAFKWACH